MPCGRFRKIKCCSIITVNKKFCNLWRKFISNYHVFTSTKKANSNIQCWKKTLFFIGVAKSGNKNLFECLVCNKRYSCKGSLHKHMKVHDKSHQCEVCLKCFESKSYLVIHMRTHTGEKPYACSTCGKKFARKHNLLRHQVAHSDEKKFKCGICQDDRYFKTKAALRNHMQLHSEPKHCCVICNKKFHTSTYLNDHMKNHFKPAYSCVKCGEKFYTSGSLKEHKERNIC